MNQPSDDKQPWKTEKGVEDASYQDFVAPLLSGLGGIPRLIAVATQAPAIASGLGAVAPTIQKLTPEFEDVGGTGSSSREGIMDLLAKWTDSAQQIGDEARMKIYQQLRLALDQSQISPDEVMDYAVRVHSDPQGL
jgi:hypothetical protein